MDEMEFDQYQAQVDIACKSEEIRERLDDAYYPERFDEPNPPSYWSVS